MLILYVMFNDSGDFTYKSDLNTDLIKKYLPKFLNYVYKAYILRAHANFGIFSLLIALFEYHGISLWTR